MAIDDEEIEKSRQQEQAGASAAKREASERRKILRVFSEKALRAKRTKDARAYAEQLRRLKIDENSLEWKKAWEFFYSDF